MNVTLTFTIRIIKFSILVFFILIQSVLIAQDGNAPVLKGFKISIEKTDKGIKMYSTNGSAWKNLSFSLPDNIPQAIDEYGMTSLDELPSQEDDKLSDYLFTITTSKEEIKIKGLKGTKWKEITYSLGNYQRHSFNHIGKID